MAGVLVLLRNGSATFRGVLGVKKGLLRVSHAYNDISTTCRTCFVDQSRRGTRRQLSSSSALTNKDQNDGEFFTATPTFDSEYSSLGVDASMTDVLAQTEDFAALGLGGYSPSGLLQSLLEFLHVNAHLPWWASIAAATITLRLLLFPLVVQMRRDATKMVNVHVAKKASLRTTASKMADYRRTGNKLAEAREAAKLMSVYRQRRVNPLPPPAIYIVLPPLFISWFMGIKGMADLPLESMKTGGLFWFTDLTIPDPTYILPLMAFLTFLSNSELEGVAPSMEKSHRKVKAFFQVSAFLVLSITINLPSGVLVYWVTNSLYTTCEILFFKIPQVKHLFGIPNFETPPEDNS